MGASHDCPVLNIHSSTDSVILVTRLLSENTMFGDFPPSSSVTRFTVSAESQVTSLPARVEPVNDIICISGCFDNPEPTSGPSP